MRLRKPYRLTATLLAFILLAATVSPRPAGAHPHIWIKNQPKLVMDGGKVVAVTQEWMFDAFFSAALIKDFDVNKDGKFDAKEIAEAKKNAFDALKDFDYFTRARIDGKKTKLQNVRDFSARIVDGKVVYRFTMSLPKPVDPRKQNAAFLFYDNTYYVDVAIDDTKSVTLENGAGCNVKIVKDELNPIYFGLVVPKMVLVTCAES